MNPILIEYCKRFEQTGKPENYTKPHFNEFFTNLEVNNHWENLPYLHNIENFCLRIYIAKLKKEKICIYSDYDTDAVTATAVMYHGLLDLGFDSQDVEFYAPDRFTEGYGMNTEAIDILSKKFDLIISVDCGINSWKEAQIVLQNNHNSSHQCDLIITDHHHLTDQIPDCIAVINCRMGEIYSTRPTELKLINQKLITELKLTLKSNSNYIIKIENWLNKVKTDPLEYISNPNKFLSQSITGVGVAWFSLVWFTYFLEYIEE